MMDHVVAQERERARGALGAQEQGLDDGAKAMRVVLMVERRPAAAVHIARDEMHLRFEAVEPVCQRATIAAAQWQGGLAAFSGLHLLGDGFVGTAL